MEPTTMMRAVATYVAKKVSENKAVNGFLSDFSKASVNWIRPIFLKEDGTEKEVIQNLREKPESKARQKAIVSALEIGIEDNPKGEQYLKEIFEQIRKTEEGGKIINTIINSIQTITGNVNGDVTQTYNEG